MPRRRWGEERREEEGLASFISGHGGSVQDQEW